MPYRVASAVGAPAPVRRFSHVRRPLTDWQGKLRVGDLVRDAAGILVRHPLHLFVLPALAAGMIPSLASALALELQPGWWWWWADAGRSWWMAQWLAPEELLVLPVIALLWGFAARKVLGARDRQPPVGQLLRAAALGTVLTLLGAATAAMAGPAALLVMVLPLTAVPRCACEHRSAVDALRLGVAQGQVHGGRLFCAWLLLMTALLACVIAVGMALLVVAWHVPHAHELLMFATPARATVVRSLWTACWVGIILALSIAAYARLRSVQIDAQEPRWVEVFE